MTLEELARLRKAELDGMKSPNGLPVIKSKDFLELIRLAEFALRAKEALKYYAQCSCNTPEQKNCNADVCGWTAREALQSDDKGDA